MASHLTFLQDTTVPGTMQERCKSFKQHHRVCRSGKRPEYDAAPVGQDGGRQKKGE